VARSGKLTALKVKALRDAKSPGFMAMAGVSTCKSAIMAVRPAGVQISRSCNGPPSLSLELIVLANRMRNG
jgi:hypothetical protein